MSVEKLWDDLWIGVKGQSNSEIARSPRNVFRNSLGLQTFNTGRATDWARGLHRLPNPDKLRMLSYISGSEAAGAKVRGREGNNPD